MECECDPCPHILHHLDGKSSPIVNSPVAFPWCVNGETLFVALCERAGRRETVEYDDNKKAGFCQYSAQCQILLML